MTADDSNTQISRRGFLAGTAVAAGGLALAGQLRGGPTTAPATQPASLGPIKPGKAKSVIQVWLGGGPPHTDTFDPKPEAGDAYCGQYKKPIETNVPGIRICEMLPLLAKQADKYSLIRSMTHGNNGHETATYLVQTCTQPSPDLCYPAMGAAVAYKAVTERGYNGSLPPYITLTGALGRFNEAGFLGGNYQTFSTGGDPSARDFAVQGLVPPPNMTPQRIAERQAMLDAVDTLGRRMSDDPAMSKMAGFQRRSWELMTGQAREVFDLSKEKAELREKYGKHRFGQSCLAARRLVENGVPYVTINFGGWDTHKEHFQRMRQLLPQLDSGLATLIEDLSDRGLLATTIVVCLGEFGRTPLIAREPPWNGGRHHFGPVFSALVAGGGFLGGQVVGQSDAKGENVKDRPVYPWDLGASMYHLLGIDPAGRLPHPQGCVARVLPKLDAKTKSGGILREIM